jgi:hypothetical protein
MRPHLTSLGLREMTWDVDMLGAYRHSFLRNPSRDDRGAGFFAARLGPFQSGSARLRRLVAPGLFPREPLGGHVGGHEKGKPAFIRAEPTLLKQPSGGRTE